MSLIKLIKNNSNVIYFDIYSENNDNYTTDGLQKSKIIGNRINLSDYIYHDTVYGTVILLLKMK